MTAKLFTDVRIFDGSGAPLFPGEVLVRGERIEAVARGDERLPREGVPVVEGHGRTLMPGMVEAHDHLTWPTSTERMINTMKPLPIEQHMLVTVQNARITLDLGFTSVYSARGCAPRRWRRGRKACSACRRVMISRTSAISPICALTSRRRRRTAATRSSS